MKRAIATAAFLGALLGMALAEGLQPVHPNKDNTFPPRNTGLQPSHPNQQNTSNMQDRGMQGVRPGQQATTQNTTTTEPEPNIGRLNDWYRTSNLAEIRDGQFYLDSLSAKDRISVFRRDQSFYNTSVSLDFMVDDTGQGSRSVGLMFGATDSENYYSLNIGRRDVQLCRVVNGNRTVLDSRGNLDKRDGQYYTARVDCQGSIIRVFLGDRFLFAHTATDLKPGFVGFYADQGRAHIRRLDFSGKQASVDSGWQLRSR